MILITGGTGLIGRRLGKKLAARGYRVAALSRTKKASGAMQAFTWDVENGKIDPDALPAAEYIVHLAGENLMQWRWTREQKRRIIDSRVKSAALLLHKLQESGHALRAFISASAIGYYGAVTSEHIFTEEDPPAHDFLGECCRQWEHAADRFAKAGARVVKVRTAPVLAREGGMLPKLCRPIKLGLGAALGTGKQYSPWIHIDDLCDIYIRAIEDARMHGAYNAAAPEHVTNRQLVKSAARSLRKPLWLPHVPGAIIRLALGEVGMVALEGSRVSSEKIRAAGYQFKFSALQPALDDLLRSQA